MKIVSILLVLVSFANFGSIVTSYKVTPSSAASIKFDPKGGNLAMKNVVVGGPYSIDYGRSTTDGSKAVTPLYLSFEVTKGILGADGIIRYEPDVSGTKLSIVDKNGKLLVEG